MTDSPPEQTIPSKILLAILAFILLVLGMVGIIRFVSGGGNNSWVCVGGEWVKYGQPSTPKPSTGCGD